MSDLKLKKSLEDWEKRDPKMMAERQSTAEIQSAFADAKHDIRVLAREIERLKAQPAAPQVTDAMVVTKEMMQRAGPAFTSAIKRKAKIEQALRAALEAALAQPGEGE